MMVPRRGLEPPHPKAHGPEPCASTNSAIWAMIVMTWLLYQIIRPADSIGNNFFVNQEKRQ